MQPENEQKKKLEKKQALPRGWQFKVGTLTILALFSLICLAQAYTLPSTEKWMSPPTPAVNMTQFNSVDTTPRGQVLVFISSSMPTLSLVEWVQQAKEWKVPILLRGFVNNTLEETTAWISALLQQANCSEEGGIEINPMAFKAYGITHVPAVVATIGPLQCTSKEDCLPAPFDKVEGNTSLATALRTLANQGEAAKEVARYYLTQQKKSRE